MLKFIKKQDLCKMFLFVIFTIAFLITIYILKAREREYIKNIKAINKKEQEIDEEMVIHQALERAGALPNHHHKEMQIKKENRRVIRDYYSNLLYLLGYFIIFVEIWYLYLSIKELIKN